MEPKVREMSSKINTIPENKNPVTYLLSGMAVSIS